MTVDNDISARTSFADAVDRLMSFDVNGRKFIHHAYDFARKRAGKSLIQDAGERFLTALGTDPAPTVFIVTGATAQRVGLPDWIGEMDGPPGAIALARTIALTHRAVPVLLTDPGQSGMLGKAAESLGLYTLPVGDVRRQAAAMPHTSSIAIMEIPEDAAQARAFSEGLINDLEPRAVITIEKCGVNEKGIFHNTNRRTNNAPGKAYAEALVKACMSKGVLSIGIGDGGNEIGFGVIKSDLLAAFPSMATCNCPCKGSFLAEQSVDCLITSAVSNWGAYALAAYIALATGKPYAGHSPGREARLIDGTARAGYMHSDGLAVPSVDGMPAEVHIAFVRILSTMVFWPPHQFGREGFLTDMLPV